MSHDGKPSEATTYTRAKTLFLIKLRNNFPEYLLAEEAELLRWVPEACQLER